MPPASNKKKQEVESQEDLPPIEGALKEESSKEALSAENVSEKKLFPLRTRIGIIQKLKLIKGDLKLRSLTWDETFDILIAQYIQSGALSKESTDELEKIQALEAEAGCLPEYLNWPPHLLSDYGIGGKWSEVAGLVKQLQAEKEEQAFLILQLQEALFQIILGIENFEEQQNLQEEDQPDQIEEDLFSQSEINP